MKRSWEEIKTSLLHKNKLIIELIRNNEYKNVNNLYKSLNFITINNIINYTRSLELLIKE